MVDTAAKLSAKKKIVVCVGTFSNPPGFFHIIDVIDDWFVIFIDQNNDFSLIGELDDQIGKLFEVKSF